jgi:hypothetical protein
MSATRLKMLVHGLSVSFMACDLCSHAGANNISSHFESLFATVTQFQGQKLQPTPPPRSAERSVVLVCHLAAASSANRQSGGIVFDSE